MAASAAVAFVGFDNAVAVVGRPWRWVLETARALGVPVLHIGRVVLVPLPELEKAFRRVGGTAGAAVRDEKISVDDAAQRVREKLGWGRTS